MTAIATNEGKLICRIKLTGDDRWVSLSLALGELGPEARLLAISEACVFEIAGLDDVAKKFSLSSWQGGIISGMRYAFRALKAPLQQVRLHELRGQLGSGDVGVVSSAAAVAVARLLSRNPDFPLDLSGWKLEEEVLRPQLEETESSPQKTVPLATSHDTAESIPPTSPV